MASEDWFLRLDPIEYGIDEDRMQNIFNDIAENNNNIDDMILELRSLNSDSEITDSEYDFILDNWEILLKNMEG